MARPLPDLPIGVVLDALRTALAPEGAAAVLVAPPGAGKTTVVPLALVSEPWCTGRIVVVEPRRLATRAAGQRMASWFGDPVGKTVGWRMRGDTKVSAATRIEVVTDGVLSRMLQHDPSLEGISLVVFDEFHERSVDADVGLAFALDARHALRPDLRLLAMSATIDGASVARLLGDDPAGEAAEDAAPVAVITCDHHVFAVATHWCGPSTPVLDPAAVAAVVRRSLAETAATGDVLVFLPGAGEIRRVGAYLGSLSAEGVDVRPLHGTLPSGEQDKALAPATPGRRKVVLATSIAETSLTIDGVTAVVDAGFARVPRFDPVRAMSGLATVRVSRAAADQRRGRAGRTAAGDCYRLWSEAEHALLNEQAEPELRNTDLVPLALDLVRWGDADGATLRWLDPPAPDGLRQARALLHDLGLITAAAQLTDHGRACLELPVHPRLAHCIRRADELGFGNLACDVVALLGARDLLGGRRGRAIDLQSRLDALHGRSRGGERAAPEAVAAVRAEAQRLRRVARVAPDRDSATDPGALGMVLALAYPDRIARLRSGAPGRFLLANGVGASCNDVDPLARTEWIVVAELDRPPGTAEARIALAAPLDERDLDAVTGDVVAMVDMGEWDARRHDVLVARERRLGAIVLARSPLDDADATIAALIAGLRVEGLGLLPRFEATAALRARVSWCRRTLGESWPDLSEPTLLETVETWLAPHLRGVRNAGGLAKVDVYHALRALLPWPLPQQLDELAPAHLTLPSGQEASIDYGGEQPLASVKMQEVFGLLDNPRVLGGRVPVALALLSPARRPLQVTSDLAGFWKGSYRQVRSEMRGRYPKHDWPENPATAAPSRGIKRRA
jgi:ATP-dependent helicase HrpB